jgi:tRNA(Ile)-lysidine synthase
VDEPELIRRANAAFDRLLPDCRCVLAAISGGPDSLALAALLADWARGRSPRIALHAATIDHELRPEAAAEAAACAPVLQSLGYRHAVLVWRDPKPAAGMQEAAREARYGLLAAHARAVGATHLVTAHHADDQAETVLLRLAAGSGIGGLAGMRETTARGGLIHVRPLLGVPKAALVAFCRSSGLPFVDDPSNASERFARARLRRAASALAAEGLTVGRLSRLAMRAARADDALEAVTDQALAQAALRVTDCVVRLDWRDVAPAPADIRLRVLLRALRAAGDEAPLRLEAAENLLADIDAAHAAGRRLRRTLAGRMVTLMTGGVMAVGPAPPRRQPVSSS